MFCPKPSHKQDGHMIFGGVDCTDLCAQYGTPLYVLDEVAIKRRCREFVRTMNDCFDDGRVAYACKAFCCKEICRIANCEGLYLDIVSSGELHTALAADFPPNRMILHGYNKPVDTLSEALKYGVGRIVVDSFEELSLIHQLAAAKQTKADILLRITPGVHADTHQAILTGSEDSKFGFSLSCGDAQRAVESALNDPFLNLHGLHCHIGSQISDVLPFELAARRMSDFFHEVYLESGAVLHELNMGGGYAIAYSEDDMVPQPEDYIRRITVVIRDRCKINGQEIPSITIEPGRSVIGPCGITLYTAGCIKNMANGRIYVAVDGGMTDNPRYALYRARYTAEVATRMNEPKDQVVTLSGRCCESGDLLGERMPLQQFSTGDIIAVLCTGAYNFSMASSYNRLPRPAVVMVKDGQTRLVVAKQRIEDILCGDI